MYLLKHLATLRSVLLIVIDYKHLVVKSYPYGRRVGKICKKELLEHIKTKKLKLKDD